MKRCATSGDGEALAALANWYWTTLGRKVAATEADCLEHLLEDCFGYYLLQLGATEQFATALRASRIRRRILLDPTQMLFAEGATGIHPGTPGNPHAARLVAAPTRLPFAADSLDAVVLPHTLDFAADPRALLGEVERVLIPDGRILVLGFNPWSFWGLRRAGLGWHAHPPWCGRLLGCGHVARWLVAKGFRIERCERLLFRPPWRGAFSPQLDWLDAFGRRYWPWFGGVYALRAVKRVVALTPVRPGRRQLRTLWPGRPVEPTARRSDHG